MLMKLFIAVLIILAAWQIIDPHFSLSSKEVVVRKAPPMDVSYETIEAHSYLNTIRRKMHMLTLSTNESLNAAAKAHAHYLVANTLSSHEEIAKNKNYVGKTPLDRAAKMGYNASMVSENLSTNNSTARHSVDGLLSAIYHRFAFLSTTINEMGVGIYQDEFDTQNSAFVYVMGNSDLNRLCSGQSYDGPGSYWKSCKDTSHHIKAFDYVEALDYGKQNNPAVILYPYDGQREVPPAFYAEIPDPLPSYDVSGFPISVEFNDYYYKDVTVLSFSLYDYKGNIIDTLLMDKANDPNQRFTKNQFAIFPKKRLDFHMKYRAEIIYRVNDKLEKYTWHFYTKNINETFYTVKKLYDTLTIEPKKSYVIYFPPVDKHDLIKDLQFPQDVDVQFIDNNTLKLTVMSEKLEEFVLNTGAKQLRIRVKGNLKH